MDNQEKRKVNIKRLLILIFILIVTIGIIIGIYFGLGLNKKFKDIEEIKVQVLAYGNFSKTIYILLHFVQTTILPISNIPTIIAGVYIFGPFVASILTIIGVLVGSMVSFAFGKIFGKKAVEWIIGKEQVDKYLKMAAGRENYIIFAILLLPGFPDDIICIIAGITAMSWKFFIISILITRTIPVFMTAYSSSIIPINTPWGIAIWVSFYIFFLLISRYVLKNWKKIENIIGKIEKNNNK